MRHRKLYRELSVFYLTNTIDAHVSTSVGFGAPRPISYSIQHFLREMLIQWTAVQFACIV
jgi:hypothetical protein